MIKTTKKFIYSTFAFKCQYVILVLLYHQRKPPLIDYEQSFFLGTFIIPYRQKRKKIQRRFTDTKKSNFYGL